MEPDARRDPQIARLTYASIAGSFGMAIALVVVHVASGSQLALAQAADSVSDMFSGVVLTWAVKQAAKPADNEHPLGHGRAEPLAALAVALLAGVLSVEVLRTAIVTLASGNVAKLDGAVAIVFFVKVAFRGGIVLAARRCLARKDNPALAALFVDARNDMLVGSVAIVGFGLARWGVPAIDSWLAIAIAVYVGISGVRLARENLGLVMSEAVASARKNELSGLAASVQGVVAIDELVATWSGSVLHVDVDIAVDGATTVRTAHEVAHAVESRLRQEADVARVIVHVNPAAGK